MKKFFFFSSLLLCSYLSEAVEIRSENYSLGKVTGVVEYEKFKTKQQLKFKNIFHFSKNEADSFLNYVVIKDSKISSINDDVIEIGTMQHGIDKNLKLSYKIEIFADGQRISAPVEQVGSDIHLKIVKEYNIIDINVISPVTIDVIGDYPGDFAITLNLEGYSK